MSFQGHQNASCLVLRRIEEGHVHADGAGKSCFAQNQAEGLLQVGEQRVLAKDRHPRAQANQHQAQTRLIQLVKVNALRIK